MYVSFFLVCLAIEMNNKHDAFTIEDMRDNSIHTHNLIVTGDLVRVLLTNQKKKKKIDFKEKKSSDQLRRYSYIYFMNIESIQNLAIHHQISL